MNINIGYAVTLAFHNFHIRGQTNVVYLEMCYKTPFSNKLYFDIHIFKALNLPLRVQINKYFSSFRCQTNVVYICKMHRYQMHRADYGLKHFKLDLLRAPIACKSVNSGVEASRGPVATVEAGRGPVATSVTQ